MRKKQTQIDELDESHSKPPPLCNTSHTRHRRRLVQSPVLLREEGLSERIINRKNVSWNAAIVVEVPGEKAQRAASMRALLCVVAI